MILLTTAPLSVVFSVTFFATPRTVAHSLPHTEVIFNLFDDKHIEETAQTIVKEDIADIIFVQ